MEATKQQIASIFNGHRVLEVPFYQRSYVWKIEQWQRFLEDMEFITHCNQDYFLGSVILKQQMTDMGESNDHRTIIDGQQRFTTLALFAKSLCLKTNDIDTFNQHFIHAQQVLLSNSVWWLIFRFHPFHKLLSV